MHPAAPPQEPAWRWTFDANAFLGWNYQYRKFTDFQEVESQNWVMLGGERRVHGGVVRLTLMLSFEPFTIQDLGSPQVFQTGETYERAPLIDYQHPHDLFMGLGASYSWTSGRFEAFVDAALVGAPSIGPEPFMHRPSASENPTAPLSHHQMDSTHITPGVLRAGVSRGGIGIDGAWFRGQEPDENRTDLDLGALDSWAVRATWRRGGWHAQVSGAHLTTPEWTEPFSDVTRLTASIGYTRADGRLAALAAWGQNRETHGVLDAYLVEATRWLTPRDAAYSRAELVVKDLLSPGGRHPQGFAHFHPLSRVGALTVGYVREIVNTRGGRWGAGGDITVHYVPPELKLNYGSPASLHLFLRIRTTKGETVPHH